MDYSTLVDKYEKLESVPSKLAKTGIVANFFRLVPSDQLSKIVLLLQGRVFPSSSESELGIATQMMMKAISKASGISTENVEGILKKTGDLGLTAEQCVKIRKQSSLMKKKLTTDHVFENLQKLATITGAGSQDKKLNLISELIISAQPKEAKYIVRTILGELRIGVAEGLLRDAVVKAFLVDVKSTDEEKKKAVDYALNIVSDFGEVAKMAKEKGIESLKNVMPFLGKPIQVMLGLAAEKIEDVTGEFGKVIAEYKYDGMRCQIHKRGPTVWVFTRRLEDVTRQFPDVCEFVRKCLKADECIVEGEVLGIKNGKPVQFQVLSQRIHRKYDIEKMAKEIPVQVNLFDVVYCDGKSIFEKPLKERRDILEKIVKPISDKFQLAKQIVSGDAGELDKFYQEALNANQEGIFLKVIDSPYVFGRHVGGWYKIKPIMETLDLAVVGATWGEGTRAKWLTSYILACEDPDTGKLLECGMMSTGLTEEQYKDMTKKLKYLIVSEKNRTVFVRPKIIVEVGYQEIQKSTNYSSGFALRFPRFIRERTLEKSEPDTLDRVVSLFKSQGREG